MKNLVRQFSLKQVILGDVILSLPIALAFVLASDVVANWAGGPGSAFYFFVGVVMLVWCIDMALVAMNERWQEKFFNLMISVDVFWSVASLCLMLWFSDSLKPLGWVLFTLNILVPLDVAWMKRVIAEKPRKPAL